MDVVSKTTSNFHWPSIFNLYFINNQKEKRKNHTTITRFVKR